MAMISKVSLPFPPEKIDGKLREASIFPSLNGGENFVRNLGMKEDDEEIGVFGAEKYFNGGMDDQAPIPPSIPARKLQVVNIAEKPDHESMEKQKIQPGTPSVRSEWSWSSQSALLQSTEKTSTKSKRNKGKGFLSRCKCFCCYKSSIDVMENTSDFKAENSRENIVRRSSKIDKFKMIESRSWLEEGIGETVTFPVSKPEPGNFPSKLQIAVDGGLHNDAGSDCSSDLFEIESLTGKSSCFHGRQSSDTTSCFTHTTRYAPSEASIEWSVITASIADCSATSDYDSDQKPAATKSWNPVLKRRPGILLGCKNEKAVGVATAAYKKNEKGSSAAPVRRRSDPFLPLTRFEAETTMTGVSARRRNQALSSHSRLRPLQTQVPNLLEIQ